MTPKITDDELRAIWKEQSDVPPERAECLTDVEWARLLSKEADGADRMRAAAHMASCAACAEEYRLLQPLQSWSAELEHVVSPDYKTAAVGWRSWLSWVSLSSPAFAMSAALVLVATQAAGIFLLIGSRRANVQLQTQLTENRRTLSSTESALQAQLRSRTGSQEELQALRRRLADWSTPQLDGVIADLDPRDAGVVRGASDVPILTAAAGSIATLILNFEPLAARSTLEVELAGKGGEVRWSGRTERDRGAANVTLTLPTEGYPPGEYTIRLFNVSRGRQLLASYQVTLRTVSADSR